MNRLPLAKRIQIIGFLVEGASLRATTRLADVSINTVTKLLIDTGRACAEYQDRTLRGLTSRRIQVDEIWAFTYAKQKNVATATAAPDWSGDIWTWRAIDADSKLVMSWLVGGRDGEYAMAFIEDLAKRLTHRVQLTSDGHRAYLEAIEGATGADVEFATLDKIYRTDPTAALGRYSLPVGTGAKKRAVEGDPDPAHVSTSYVERQNLTMRMHVRRFTRLTNGFSKKVDKHAHAVALHFMFYNFCRIHKTLRETPAMEAGVTDRLWTLADLAEMA